MKKLANGSAVIRSLAVIIIVVFFLFPVWLYAGSKSPAAAARDLGVVGNTYPVAEPDALQEIREKAKSMDLKRSRAKLEIKAKDFRPENLPVLKTATANRSFTVDLTWSLGFDITDGKGRIVYPKGYTFNPLDYVRYARTIVVINGGDKRQVGWFENSGYSRDINTLLLITDGSYYRLGQKLRRQVFYANSAIVERFGLKAAPSVIQQKGSMLEVKEIAVTRD